ncbi:hypothetical protein [Candidatus Tisiphia endosymbiont of Temnostethus pusillus]|uniref:hypothetical protein n=1 Tax=Candidatus Tisiphia endosymbiont of Temnostethus pusillus TaxID=3139335 RepID=UPI0035C88E0B
MNWIKSRLNKDNFWNLMFWWGMSFGLFLSVFLDEYKYVSNALFWITILLVPYLVAKYNKVKYTEDKMFLNSQGQNLMNRLPKQLFWIIIAMIAVVALTGSILDAHWKEVNDFIAFPLLFSIFLFVPTLYFIYKNCPISILFNKNAWQERIIGMRAGAYNANYSTSTFSSNNIYYTGIEYRNFPSNMYYHRK